MASRRVLTAKTGRQRRRRRRGAKKSVCEREKRISGSRRASGCGLYIWCCARRRDPTLSSPRSCHTKEAMRTALSAQTYSVLASHTLPYVTHPNSTRPSREQTRPRVYYSILDHTPEHSTCRIHYPTRYPTRQHIVRSLCSANTPLPLNFLFFIWLRAEPFSCCQ